MADKQISGLPPKLTSDNTDLIALDTIGGITYKQDKETFLKDISERVTTLDGNGVVSGMAISINTDTTKVDIASGSYNLIGTGVIPYVGESAVVLTNIATHNVTYLALNSSNVIVQKTSPFTMSERRDYILLGAAIHSNFTSVNVVNNLPDVALVALAQLGDLMDGLGNFNRDGNVFSENGANLFINKSSGQIYKRGVNFHTDNANPHVIDLASLSAPSNLRYRLSDGTEYSDTNSIDPEFYENAGVKTAVPINKFSIQRITVFPSNLVRLQYGQDTYVSEALAIQNICCEPFTIEQNLEQNGLLRAFVIVQQGETNLENASFIEADRFGKTITSGSGAGTTSMQQSYNNSTTPEIATDSTRGAVTIKEGAGDDDNNVLEIQNGAGAVTAKIDGHGNLQTNNSIVTKENTGFSNQDDIVVSYNSTARTITLTGTFEAHWRGELVSVLTNGWVSDAHPDVPGKYFLSYDDGTFSWSTTPWRFDTIQIAYANYVHLFGLRETHGFMQHGTHETLHQTTGTYRESGGDISSYVENSTVTAERQPDISLTVVDDENLHTSNSSLLGTSADYTRMSLSGAGATEVFALTQSDIVYSDGTNLYWNEWTGATWQQTLVDVNDYMSMWLVAVPVTADTYSQKFRYIFVQGQSQSNLASTQRALSTLSLNLATFAELGPESVFITQFIIKRTPTDWEIEEVNRLNGTRVSQISSTAGNYLSTVSVDGTTITGNGTSTDPLVAQLTDTQHTDLTDGGISELHSHNSTELSTKTANYTLVATDSVIISNLATALTHTLSTAVGISGRMYTIKNINTGVVTIATTGAETIDAGSTYTLNQWQSLEVISDGSIWLII